jgi:hypothetical protein
MTRPNSSHTGKRREPRNAVTTAPVRRRQRAACEEAIGYRFKDKGLCSTGDDASQRRQGKSLPHGAMSALNSSATGCSAS